MSLFLSFSYLDLSRISADSASCILKRKLGISKNEYHTENIGQVIFEYCSIFFILNFF